MRIGRWIELLERRGFRFVTDGESIDLEAPEELYTPRRRAMLIRHKKEVIAHLIDRGAVEILRQVIHPVGSRGPEYDNPMDYRRDPKTGEWIVDPGWWRRIPPGGGKRAS